MFVALAYAPWVLRVGADGTMTTHTSKPVASLKGAWMDQQGIIVLQTELGAALIDDRDIESISAWLSGPDGAACDEDRITEALERIQAGEDAGLWLSHGECRVPLLSLQSQEVPARLAFVREPKPLPGEKAGY
ncbi:MAG TPA: DUF2946 family protein [Thermomicrobiales bacterium]|nr:DUF2946 family protein [Thermomicrobiales bacterium]